MIIRNSRVRDLGVRSARAEPHRGKHQFEYSGGKNGSYKFFREELGPRVVADWNFDPRIFIKMVGLLPRPRGPSAGVQRGHR